jgi:hypothetical protein
VIPQVLPGLAQRDDFGMGGGIVLAQIAIAPMSHHPAFKHNHGANRDFAGFERALSGSKRFFHPEFVRAELGWGKQSGFTKCKSKSTGKLGFAGSEKSVCDPWPEWGMSC